MLPENIRSIYSFLMFPGAYIDSTWIKQKKGERKRDASSNPRVKSSKPRVRRLKARVARLKARVGRLKHELNR